jgi:arginyl-tRNA synthetase
VLLREQEAYRLCLSVSDFPDVVASALRQMESSVLVFYIVELCHAISSAAYVLRVKDMDSTLANARMALLTISKMVLEKGMRLLGLKPINRM